MTLAVVQESFASSYEKYPSNTQANDFIYRFGQAGNGERIRNLISLALATNTINQLWRYPVGQGFSHPSYATTEGDVMYRRRVRADASWASALSISPQPPQLSGQPGLIPNTFLFSKLTVELDCIAYSETQDPPDQGYFLRWLAPGISLSMPDTVFNFYFGQYCLIIGGSGEAILAEYCRPANGSAYRWQRRTTFRYCKLGQAIGAPHTMTIFPHRGPNGEKYIIFAGADVEAVGATSALLSASRPGRAHTQEFLYQATDIQRGGDMDESPGHATRAGVLRLDCRRDIRAQFHFSQMLFWARGTVRDAAVSMPDYATLTQGGFGYAPRPFEVKFRADYPEDYKGKKPSLEHGVRDVNTLDASAIRHPAVVINFKGSEMGPVVDNDSSSYKSPILWGYVLSRPPQLKTEKQGRPRSWHRVPTVSHEARQDRQHVPQLDRQLVSVHRDAREDDGGVCSNHRLHNLRPGRERAGGSPVGRETAL